MFRLMALVIALASPAFSICCVLYPNATWYVDSVNGSDSNTGHMVAGRPQPFATIGKLLTQTIASGDSVGLAYNSHWRETLQIPTTHIALIGYGTGSLPIIDGSDSISSGSWTKTGGQTFVYQSANLPLTNVGANSQVIAFEDGTHLTRETSIANCDAAAGSFYASSDTVGPITLYVHASDNSNPASNGKTYEYTARQYAINAFSDYLTVLYVSAKRALTSDGAMRAEKYAYFYNTVSSEGYTHNYYAQGGSFIYGAEAYDGGFGQFVFHQDDPTGYSATCQNCYAHGIAALQNAGGSGVYAHTGGIGKWANITLINLRVDTQSGCAGAADTQQFNVINISCASVSFGIEPDAVSTTVTGGSIDPGSGNRGLDLDGATNQAESVTVSGVTFPHGKVFALRNNTSISIQTSSFSDTTGSTIYNNGTGNTFTLLNNTYAYPSGSNTYWFNVLYSSLTSDYNAFSSSSAQFQWPSILYTLTQYKAATGQDQHSTP